MNEFFDWHPEKEKYTHFYFFIFLISLRFTFGNGCCHITRINNRSGNEPKPFHPVFPPNQVFFYPMFQNTLMITCSTSFQGAVNTYQKCDQICLKKSLYAQSCSVTQLPCPTTPQPLLCALLSSSPGRLPSWCPVLGQGRTGLPPPLHSGSTDLTKWPAEAGK